MRAETLILAGEPRVPIRLVDRGATLLVECREPGPLLDRITAGRGPATVPPDTILRGVVYRDSGEAVFQLFDTLGGSSEEYRLKADVLREWLPLPW